MLKRLLIETLESEDEEQHAGYFSKKRGEKVRGLGSHNDVRDMCRTMNQRKNE